MLEKKVRMWRRLFGRSDGGREKKVFGRRRNPLIRREVEMFVGDFLKEGWNSLDRRERIFGG